MIPRRFPLEWPPHWPRTKKYARGHGPFRSTPGRTRDHLFDELRKMRATNVVLSTDIPVRRDGEPYANTREPDDPGAAVYFRWDGKPYVIACDKFEKVWSNVRALGKTIEAMRAVERHGASSLLERAVSGFSALPPAPDIEEEEPPPPWWEVLDVPDGLDYDEIAADSTNPARVAALQLAEMAYRKQVKEAHPDRGGSNEAMAELARSIQEAREVLA